MIYTHKISCTWIQYPICIYCNQLI